MARRNRYSAEFKHSGRRCTSYAGKTRTPSTLPIVNPHTARCRPEPTSRAIAGIARWTRPAGRSLPSVATSDLGIWNLYSIDRPLHLPLTKKHMPAGR